MCQSYYSNFTARQQPQIMHRGPNFSAMAFSVGNFRVTCEVQESLLKLSLASIVSPEPQKLSLSKLVSSDSSIQIIIESLPPSCPFAPTPTASTYALQSIEGLNQKIDRLEREVKSFEQRISTKGQTQGWAAKHLSLGRYNAEIHAHEEAEQDSQARMEMLNNVLQQKLQEKEGNIVELERRLMEREELVRELADKLITANIEKQDIFVEYQKILQNTVFSKLEESKPEQVDIEPGVTVMVQLKEEENQLQAIQ